MLAIPFRGVVKNMVELGGGKEAGSSTTLCAVSNVPVELRKTSCVGSKRPSRCEGKENSVHLRTVLSVCARAVQAPN